MAGAWAVAPHLPGADAEPLFDTHGGRGGVTEIVSPLVDIRSRIVNQAETELFTMQATGRVVLADLGAARFDGDRWDAARRASSKAPTTRSTPPLAGLGRQRPGDHDHRRSTGRSSRWRPSRFAGSDGIGAAYNAD